MTSPRIKMLLVVLAGVAGAAALAGLIGSRI